MPQQAFLKDRNFIQRRYDGFPGALTALTGWLNGHEALAARLIRPEGFNVRGCKRILDAGCGNGRYSKFLLRQADPGATITAFDLSQKMLRRARRRVRSERIGHVAADVTRLPFADATFDAAVCGWMLEHLPDPCPGLQSLARVLRPGAKLLLMMTEDTFPGRWCARLWHCRTHRRKELKQACQECGLNWGRELWFSKMHGKLKLGGIIVELVRVRE